MHSNNIYLTSIEEFISADITQIKNIVREQKVNCAYLAIDGTRRHFILKTGIDYSDPLFFDKYFDSVIMDTVNLLKIFYDHGVENIIILLMDDTAFERGEKYVTTAIKQGIEPTLSDTRFLSFYNEYNIRVHYAGFNYIYSDCGFAYIIDKMKIIQENTINNKLTLTYYTGSSGDRDYIRLMQKYATTSLIDENTASSEQKLSKHFYGQELPKIDFSIYFGYPREKVKPVLLWGNSINFYTNNPTLSLNSTQLRKAIYLTILSRTQIKDDYHQYLLKSPITRDIQNDLIGEKDYMDQLNLM